MKLSAQARVDYYERDAVIIRWRNEYEPPLADVDKHERTKIKEYQDALKWLEELNNEEMRKARATA